MYNTAYVSTISSYWLLFSNVKLFFKVRLKFNVDGVRGSGWEYSFFEIKHSWLTVRTPNVVKQQYVGFTFTSFSLLMSVSYEVVMYVLVSGDGGTGVALGLSNRFHEVHDAVSEHKKRKEKISVGGSSFMVFQWLGGWQDFPLVARVTVFASGYNKRDDRMYFTLDGKSSSEHCSRNRKVLKSIISRNQKC